MARKGVSPLIAAVLLIAFTMAVAAILTAWVTTFTQEQTEAVGNESEQLIQCSYAAIDIYDATYDAANSQTTVSVSNTGTVDLNNVTVVALQDGAVMDAVFITNLRASAVKTSPALSTASTPDRVRAQSQDCPAVSTEETQIGTS